MSKKTAQQKRATMATGSTAVANSISKPEGLGRKRSNSHACCTTCCREDNRLRGRVKMQHGFPTVDCRGPLSSSNNTEKRRTQQSLQYNGRNNRATLSFSLSIYRSICLSIYLYLSIYLPTYLSSYLSIYLPFCLFIFLSIYVSIYLSTYLSIYLFIFLSSY